MKRTYDLPDACGHFNQQAICLDMCHMDDIQFYLSSNHLCPTAQTLEGLPFETDGDALRNFELNL